LTSGTRTDTLELSRGKGAGPRGFRPDRVLQGAYEFALIASPVQNGVWLQIEPPLEFRDEWRKGFASRPHSSFLRLPRLQEVQECVNLPDAV
jgi:hypothetical protein